MAVIGVVPDFWPRHRFLCVVEQQTINAARKEAKAVEPCGGFCFAKIWKGFILIIAKKKREKGVPEMSMAEVIALLQQENERLRRENEILLLTVKQIRETVNRLLERYVLNEGAEQI